MPLLDRLLASTHVLECVDIGPDRAIRTANPAFARHIGLSDTALAGRHITDFLAAHEWETITDWVGGSFPPPDEPQPVTFVSVTGDLYTLWCSVDQRDDVVRIIGEPRSLDDQRAAADLMHLNNEMATLSRENVRRRRELDEAMRALRMSQHQLLEANTAITETNRKLNQFVGMAAHDLRNPLTVMIGFAKFMMMDPQAVNFSERQARFIASIATNAEFMLRLVNNLLDVSKIEAGEISLERKPTDVVALVEANIGVNRILSEEKSIHFVFQQPKGVPLVNIDPDKIEQVLNNLLSNAAKFSPGGSTVTVTLERQSTTVVLKVTDQGQGIPADEMDKLFKPFSRTSVKATMGEKSTGLGLLIAKQVVAAHGGTIEAVSEVGRGTTFVVELPL